MTKKELFKAIDHAFLVLQKKLPIKTGNMAFKATQKIGIGEKSLIYIKESIAPYSKYLNNPDWKSYKFWDKSIQAFFNDLEKTTKTKIKQKGG